MEKVNEREEQQIHDGEYRKGYCHGYIAAIEDLEAKHSIHEMKVFFDLDLMNDWRYRQNINDIIIPPVLRFKNQK